MPEKSHLRAHNKKTADAHTPFKTDGFKSRTNRTWPIHPNQNRNNDHFQKVDKRWHLVELHPDTKEFVNYRLPFQTLILRGLKVSNLPIAEPKGLKKAVSWLKGASTKAKPTPFSQQQKRTHLLVEAHSCSELNQKLTLLAHHEVARVCQHSLNTSIVCDLLAILITLKRAADHNWQTHCPDAQYKSN